MRKQLIRSFFYNRVIQERLQPNLINTVMFSYIQYDLRAVNGKLVYSTLYSTKKKCFTFRSNKYIVSLLFKFRIQAKLTWKEIFKNRQST